MNATVDLVVRLVDIATAARILLLSYIGRLVVYAGAGLGPGTWLGLIGTGQLAAFGTGSDSSESVLPYGFQLLECLLPSKR